MRFYKPTKLFSCTPGGLERYTAVVEHNLEYVASQQQENFINAQIVKAATQQTVSIVHKV